MVEYLPSSALLKPDAPKVGLRPMTVMQLITGAHRENCHTLRVS